MKKKLLPLIIIGSLFAHLAFAEPTPTPLDEKTLLGLANEGQAEAQFNLVCFINPISNLKMQ